MDNIDTWIAVLISISMGVIFGIAVQLIIVPWQRRKITGSAHTNGPVKFTINDSNESNESTPSGSPKRNRRPTSFVQSDSKPLPAITEQTELASFNNLGGLTPSLYTNDKTADFANGKKKHVIANGGYKIDPKIVEKAEHLLGKDRSLDNTDLTITSLNFIDDHQQNGHVHGRADCKTLQTYFDTNHTMSPPKKTG